MRKKYILLFLMIIPPLVIYFTQLFLANEMKFVSNNEITKFSRKRRSHRTKKVNGNDSCIFHYNGVVERDIYRIISVINEIDILYTYCYEIYGIFPVIGNVEQDKDVVDMKIIRYIYPKPLEFILLLPLHLENNKNVFFDINSNYSNYNLSESVTKYFLLNESENCSVKTSEEMNVYLLSSMHLRYVWTYFGSRHFRENIEEIMKDPFTFKYYYEKNPLNKSINYFTRFDTNHSSIYPNNEVGIIERLRYRNHIDKQMKYYKLYNNLTTIIFGQNDQFIDYRTTIEKYMNLYNIYLIWCSNYNSGFYLTRLLHLLLRTEFTIIIDDDFILTPNYVAVSKYLIPKYNCIISNKGFQSYKFQKMNLNYSERIKMDVKIKTFKMWFVLTLFGGQIAKTEMFTYPFRMKLPFKYWGDDVGNGQIGDLLYGLKQVVIKEKSLNLIFLKTSKKTSESFANHDNYVLGPKILCPFITYCGRYRTNVTMNKKCFFPVPSVLD